MKIVLVMLYNLQPYIEDNIKQLKSHNNNDIVIITDNKFDNFFEGLNVTIINIEKLIPEYLNIISNINNTFRNGFWKLTSYRFLAIYEYMKKYNINNIVHVENDVLIYTNIDSVKFHSTNKLLLTMDSKNRCIPGIMYIPNYIILKRCIDSFNPNLNDMQNFSLCFYKYTNYIDSLPIFIENNDNDISKMITANYKYYNAIFDAAAIGQYLGGIDPRNKEGDTTGFINETCIFNYSKYNFTWKNINNKKIPFLIIENQEIPIINLHIHSKDLKKFI